MKVLKFMFTARITFILLALLAFVATVLHIGWVHQPEGHAMNHQWRVEQKR